MLLLKKYELLKVICNVYQEFEFEEYEMYKKLRVKNKFINMLSLE